MTTKYILFEFALICFCLRLAYGTVQSMYDYQRTATLEVVVKEWQLIPQADIYIL